MIGLVLENKARLIIPANANAIPILTSQPYFHYVSQELSTFQLMQIICCENIAFTFAGSMNKALINSNPTLSFYKIAFFGWF